MTEFHVSRTLKSGSAYKCKACAAAYYLKNRAVRLKDFKKYRELNIAKVLARALAYRQANRVKERARSRKWVSENPGKVAVYRRLNHAATMQKLNEWIKKNPHRIRANTARRRADKIKATPAWADHAAIRDIYKVAGKRGLHVDHIVPLRSRLVCGLHVEHNLQLLTPRENALKGNRFWPDMPTTPEKNNNETS